MVMRKFEVGGVYAHRPCNIPFKVTRITAGSMWIRQVHGLSGGGNIDTMSDGAIEVMSDGADEVEFALFAACEFHCIHPFFSSDNSVCKAYLRDHSFALPAWLCRFHKDIMKTFLVFFFSVKLVVLARRVKERMYAPGGVGFIAARKNFDCAVNDSHAPLNLR